MSGPGERKARPAPRASDAEAAAEAADSPWGEDHHRWRWCDPTMPGGGARTRELPVAEVAEVAEEERVEAPLAHPRLIRRTR